MGKRTVSIKQKQIATLCQVSCAAVMRLSAISSPFQTIRFELELKRCLKEAGFQTPQRLRRRRCRQSIDEAVGGYRFGQGAVRLAGRLQ
jgi:hypothetical protein